MSEEARPDEPAPTADDERPPTEPAPAPATGDDATTLPDDAILIVPLRNLVLFPGVVLPVLIGRERSKLALQEALRRESPIGLVLQRDPELDDPAPEDLHAVGTTASILRYVTTPEGHHHAICQGEARFRIVEYVGDRPILAARIERLEEDPDVEIDRPTEARFMALKKQAAEALELLPNAPAELHEAIGNVPTPSMLADMVATFLDIKSEERQSVLETFDVAARIERVSQLLSERLEVLRLSREITQQTRGTLDKAQREYYLREQLKTIQKELGEEDARQAEMAELERRIVEAAMPEEVEATARKELRRLERMNEASGEYSTVRTYIESLTELPWSTESEDRIDVAAARAVLDEDHYDLDRVKRRILEFLAVRKLNPTGRSPILCLVGPPGVGKTSLGKSVARAMGREFVRISLGGVHDEAEIRGHRRTYVGALPGSIVQAIKKAGTRNPVFLMDEMDKLGQGGFRGDPASALLEVLDPAQNSTFRDNYLAVPFDLSRVMFLGTANVLDTIPGPLRDRLEILQLPGYTEADKMQIARRYLVARQLTENGLGEETCRITDPALRRIIGDYTREAGCRNLEREIGSVCRHVATRIAEGTDRSVTVGPDDLPSILGPPRFESELKMRTSVPGVATGLAWTPVGGDILFIEATRMHGKGILILTGQLGDVMKESAQTALSLIRSRIDELSIGPEDLAGSDLHIHVPAGAIPKDGPSAGVAIFVALYSLLEGRQVHSDVAMTGEISLRGLVLPVGGIKEKVLAAHRAGIRTVLLPARNRKDFEDIPAEVREELRFVWLERVEDATAEAIGWGSAGPVGTADPPG